MHARSWTQVRIISEVVDDLQRVQVACHAVSPPGGVRVREPAALPHILVIRGRQCSGYLIFRHPTISTIVISGTGRLLDLGGFYQSP